MVTLLFTPALMAVALFILIPTSFLLILYVKTASSTN